MISTVKTYINDFISLFYPVNCCSCGKNLVRQEEFVCSECLYLLPKTNFQYVKDNPVSKVFWGRAQIENATACYFFMKGGILQKLIHQLKYKGVKEIGFVLGKQLGAELQDSELFIGVDNIIPVPLHPKRQKQRGYNQSEYIAMGISEILGKEVVVNNLNRVVETSTQTKKTRFERWENVENIFRLKNPEALENKHVLLVDDVLTTGATLEACANALLKIKSIKVSVATLGYVS